MGRPALKREAVMYLTSHHRISQRRACALLRHPRSTRHYRSVKERQLALRQRMREIAQVRVRFGYRRIHLLLRREGWKHGRGKTYRLYTEERLQLRSKLPKRRKMVVQRHQRMQPGAPDDAWTMDFVADQLANGTKFRALTVVDVFTREALAIEVGQRLKGEDVVATLDRIMGARGKPKHLFVDNGSEFSGRMLDLWAYHHKVRIDFSPPGKPTDNFYVETFNGSLRDECLNLHWFESLGQAREIIEAWRHDYNESRPHMALADAAPREYARRARLSACRQAVVGAED